jgi:hypothetical protein
MLRLLGSWEDLSAPYGIPASGAVCQAVEARAQAGRLQVWTAVRVRKRVLAHDAWTNGTTRPCHANGSIRRRLRPRNGR